MITQELLQKCIPEHELFSVSGPAQIPVMQEFCRLLVLTSVVALLPVSYPSGVRSAMPQYPSSVVPSLYHEVGGLESSLGSLRASDPFADSSFDYVKDEITKLDQIQEHASRIMNEIQNLSSENSRICENMMSALETAKLRGEQDLTRRKQMEAFGLRFHVRIDDLLVFSFSYLFLLFNFWSRTLLKLTASNLSWVAQSTRIKI